MNKKVFQSKLLVISVIFLFILLTSADVLPQRNVSAESDVKKLIQEGKELYKNGEYKEAILKLLAAKDLAQTRKEISEIHFNISLAYYADNQSIKASEHLQKLLEIQPEKTINTLDYHPRFVELFNKIKSEVAKLKEKRPVVKAKPGEEKKVKKGGGGFLLVIGALVIGGGAAALLLMGKKSDGGTNGGITTGSIQVNSSPTGAQVFLDGSNTGETTNCTLTDVSSGSHTVNLVMEGYEDEQMSVSVTAGQTATVSSTLTPPTITVIELPTGTVWTTGKEVEIKWGVSGSGASQGIASTGAGLNSLIHQGRNVLFPFQRRGLQERRFLRSAIKERRSLEDVASSGNRDILSSNTSEPQGVSGETSTSVKEGDIVQKRAKDIRDIKRNSRVGIVNAPVVPQISSGKFTQSGDIRVLGLSNVKIDLYKGSTFNQTIVSSTENDGSYLWTVDPSLEDGTDYKVRISSPDDSAVYGESDAFSIEEKSITVTEPTDTTVWAKSFPADITWTSIGTISAVKIDLYKGDTLNQTIVSSTANDGSYAWTEVDTSLADGTDYQVRISSIDDSTVYGESEEFEISSFPEIEWVQVPAGSFEMGDNFNEGYSHELPVHTVYLDTYSISKYEVTFEQYDAFCDATSRTKPGDEGWGRGARPVINVTWNDAKAFCDWLAGETGENIHLPTDAQWEKAARGTDQRRYPWGDGLPNSNLANYSDNVGKTMPVGSYPSGVSPYGIHDMAGNVNELCNDWFDYNYYKISPTNNPQGPSSGSAHVERGGGWHSNASYIRSAHKVGSGTYGGYFIGFRFCKDVPVANSITVTEPTSNTVWTKGDSAEIAWTSTGSINAVKLDLYKGGTFNQTIVSSTVNNGSYTWTEVDTSLVDGIDYRVKASSADDSSIYGESETFTIEERSITVTSPTSSTIWAKGYSADISWTSIGTISNVKIDLYKGDTFNQTIVSSTANDGSYTWTQVDTSLAAGSDYKIRISSTIDSSIYGESDEFQITHEMVFITKWGSNGSGNGEFDSPKGITVDSTGYVYVADTLNNRIQKLTSGGTFVTKWGSQGSGDGQFDNPQRIAVDSSGYVYVADSYNHRIQKFTSSGSFVTKWGSYGSGDGQFSYPFGIELDGDGYVYISDYYNNRIQKFTSGGTFVTKWGSEGSGNGQFNKPEGIAVDSSGYVYVADSYNHRIQKFTSGGIFIATWGNEGSGDGQFNAPCGIAIDGADYLYVSDTLNSRIQKFTSIGVFVTKWGSQGSGDGQFDRVYGIAADESGYVYVADFNNHRIQIFGPASSTQQLTQSNSKILNNNFSVDKNSTQKSSTIKPSNQNRLEQLKQINKKDK